MESHRRACYASTMGRSSARLRSARAQVLLAAVCGAVVLLSACTYLTRIGRWQRHCNGGNQEACWRAGEHHEEAGNQARAIEYHRKGCDAELSSSCARMGAYYAVGKGVRQNWQQAADFLEKACAEWPHFLCLNAGAAYFAYVPDKKAHGVALMEKSCNVVPGRSCVLVGQIYEIGDGVPEDLQRAAEWYEKICDNPIGGGDACYHLGYLHEAGQGVPRDLTRAASLFEKACGEKSTKGCFHAGAAYMDGKGVTADPKRAAGFFATGCDANHGDACFKLARCYMLGEGVQQDGGKAMELLDKACTAGSIEACQRLRDSR